MMLLTYCVTSSALELKEASLTMAGSPVGEQEHRVTLPDTWQASADAHAIYRLHFHLNELPQEQWALRIDRLSSGHQIYLNGELVHELCCDAQTRPKPLPFYLPIAPSLLKVGDNELRLELRFRARGGLSTVQLGPDAELRSDWLRDRAWDSTLPQGINVAGAALAILMLMVWWRRRQELATGLFGLMWLVGSLRNYHYFMQVSPLPDALAEWLYFCAQAVTASLFGLFAVALSGRPWPRLRRLYLAALIALPLLGLAAWALGQLPVLRMVVYPLLVLLCASVARILWPLLQRQRGVALALLVCGSAVLAGAGAHDYAYLNGWVPISDYYWLPLVAPFVLACYGAMLLDRIILSLARSEELSHELELRVAERTAQLAEANAEKSRFLAIASHDLRQPVAAIGLLVGMADEQVRQANPRASALLAKAGQAIAGLEDLLRSLLDVSRLDVAHAAAPVLQAAKLQAIFDAIALHEQASAQARGLRLHFRATTAVALSDPLLLEQMLRNLVANALRYTERGGVLVCVRRRGAKLFVQVWDSGRGIAPEHRQQIFEEFVQPGLQAHAATAEGVGLGLAIVRRSASWLGHGLGLRSQVGKGSCFWIELPNAAT